MKSFAIVMATGIVSLACSQLQLTLISQGLLICNLMLSGYLVLFNGIQMKKYPHQVISDLLAPATGFDSFTIVAACCILGSQFLQIVHLPTLALALWCVGLITWLLLSYSLLAQFIVRRAGLDISKDVHGGWLLLVVATQAVSVSGTSLSREFPVFHESLVFLSLSLWLVGGLLYLWVISLILYRTIFFTMNSESLAPPHWISMGAMAISTLAGASLISIARDSMILSQVLPFVKGLTLLCWVTATWWIPLLVILGVWRHILQRVSFSYDSQFWSIVFPLGMYSVSTHRLAVELNFSPLMQGANLVAYLALGAWLITIIKMTCASLPAGSAIK
ncbi:MAG: C4-dicarboxylate ABC transporter [Gimesia sp.]|uniref:C4-dicarboxylate ABC transporter n=1 Tax=Gimesia maris TaxID=122 RepID=A0A3D3REX8_9PLAN|nr:C4-dicarboxylate ABC transporter [Gimesia sp.]HCO26642.1 C4-dicarboxylate ABC transporter [Gimesia maris]|tara:strand:+ start:3918 stop:4916 length:999 start_codon:yes stop_codon:yes gene_type:complete